MRLLSMLLVASTLAAECVSPQLTPGELARKISGLASEAQAAVDRGDLASAVKSYRQLACLEPRNPNYAYVLGSAEAAVGNFPEARAALEKADELRPESPVALPTLLRLYATTGDQAAVRKLLRDAAQRFPHEQRVHAEFARTLAESNLFDLALAEALRASSAGAGPESVRLLAALELKSGAYRDAARDALVIVNREELAPEARADAADLAGRAFELLEQREDAVKYLTIAATLDPMREGTYLALGRLHEQSSEYDGAIQVLERGHQNVPGSKEIALVLGSNLAQGGRYEDAAAIFQTVVENHPDEHEAYLGLSVAYRGLNQRGRELAALQEVVRRRPDYPMIHVLLAQARLNLRPPDYAGVLQDLDRAQAVDPSDPEIDALRGRVYLATKQYANAVAALRSAVEGWPSSSETRYLLGRAYLFLGEEDLAKQEFERVEHLKRLEAAAVR